MEPLIIVDFQQRGLNFCVRSTPPVRRGGGQKLYTRKITYTGRSGSAALAAAVALPMKQRTLVAMGLATL